MSLETARAPIAASTRVDDTGLVLALRAGEDWAFQAIWDRYSARVSRFFARYVGSSANDVEDLRQSVFLRVFKSRRAIEKPGSLRYFVMSVATHVLKEELRSKQVRRRIRLTPTGDVPEVAMAARADDEAREALRRCYEILGGLRLRERVAFELRYLDGKTIPEIAIRLEASVSTVKRLIGSATNKVLTKASRAPDLGRYCRRSPSDEGVPGRAHSRFATPR